jgi:hypothetical protein
MALYPLSKAAAAAALKGKNCTVQIAPAPLFYG